jgi:hypothetical protein
MFLSTYQSEGARPANQVRVTNVLTTSDWLTGETLDDDTHDINYEKLIHVS